MRVLTATCLVTVTLGACAAEDTPARAQTQAQARTRARVVRPYDGITIRLDAQTVEVEGWTCRDSGPILQIACAAGTREHESLLVVAPQPSEIHAALLMAGLGEGAPGRWVRDGDGPRFEPPTGAAVDVSVRYAPRPGETLEAPISTWVRLADGTSPLPGNTWIFGGSHLVETPAWVGGEAQLAADLTGSVIGLATFGDEVLGLPQGVADPADGNASPWSIRCPPAPPIGTPVTLLLRPAAAGG